MPEIAVLVYDRITALDAIGAEKTNPVYPNSSAVRRA